MLRLSEGKARKYTSLEISCSKALWDSNRQAPKWHHPNKDLIEAIIAQTINTYRTKSLELMS